ncbi:lantibiotic dehydratase [Algoriphagus aquimarinus]|uniref:lantibiotic dehydratase n=1 Tax=Algoriphagus aquimarinus TaxID=237018 RepID=UPI0030D7CD48
MSFLYRVPLFQFNIEDPASLEHNREIILKAIKLSSTDFSRELAGIPFHNLDEKLKIKLRKYLLRGRFRPTPFGGFAGVGKGKWGKDFKLDFPLSPNKISDKNQPDSNVITLKPNNCFDSNYCLVPGAHKKQGYYHALVYDKLDQSWTKCTLPVNQLFETLFETAADKPIKFHEFHQLLDPQNSSNTIVQAKNLWKQILDTGFLTPENGMKSKKKGVDMVLENSVEIPEKIRQQLQQFIDSAGSLFAREESMYLKDFKKWLTHQYDDRYVSLHDLMTTSEFMTSIFQQQNKPKVEKDFASSVVGNNNQKTIDLQQFYPKKVLDEDIYDVQLLYRLNHKGNPVIENMVCNRPFVYTGRFNRDPRILSHSQKISKNIYTDDQVIYAHVKVHENEPVNHICDIKNIFNYEITAFQPVSKNQLNFKDLYLGIYQNKIHLIHKPSGRQVIPVVMHPLNGEQITHPVLRLLWEAAHQDRFRFLPYQSSIFTQSPYCPQLNWGDLCLQSNRWKLSKERLADTKGLSQRLDEMDIPQHILAGNQDRELLLNRHNQDDLHILWQELQRNGILSLSNPRWYPSCLFQSTSGTAAYPQFVFQYSRPQLVPKIDNVFNPLAEKQKNCLCFTIQACDSEVSEVLECLFHRMGEADFTSRVPCWFFLIYGKKGASEIRLRILDILPEETPNLLTHFASLFSQENWEWKIASYFPETVKYGNKGLKTSHRLFHLESKFLATKSDGITHMNLPSLWKENFLVSLWRTIFTQSPNYRQVFTELQKDVKSLSSELVRKYKIGFLYLKTTDTSYFEPDEYLEIIQSHEYFYSNSATAVPLLLNHLHMMVNRFFPTNTLDHERRIRYRIYRETGKHIYSQPKAITTASAFKPRPQLTC